MGGNLPADHNGDGIDEPQEEYEESLRYNFWGIKSRDGYKLVLLQDKKTGEVYETMFDLNQDPYELDNLLNNKLTPEQERIYRDMKDKLKQLLDCKGPEECNPTLPRGWIMKLYLLKDGPWNESHQPYILENVWCLIASSTA